MTNLLRAGAMALACLLCAPAVAQHATDSRAPAGFAPESACLTWSGGTVGSGSLVPCGAVPSPNAPARDANGDLRVPTVTVTPFYVALVANTSTELLAASATRIGYDLQCTGSAAVALSRTHATLTSATPGAAGADLVIPAGATPYFQPAYVSSAGVTAYTGTAQACWGVSYARQ